MPPSSRAISAPSPGRMQGRGFQALSHTHRAKHHLDSTSHASGTTPSPAFTFAPEPSPAQRPGVWPSGRRFWGPRDSPSPDRRLARLAKVVERAWLRVAREAVGAEGRKAKSCHNSMAQPHDCPRRTIIRPPTPRHACTWSCLGPAWACCDATLVSPLTRTGHHNRAGLRPTVRRCESRSAAGRWPTRTQRAAGHSARSC